MMTRYPLAKELRDQGLPEEAVLLLEGRVDLARVSPATKLYLQSLAAARRDQAFREAVATAAPVVRQNPEILWTAAAHAWNMGDLGGAFDLIENLLKQAPENPQARLFKIEILARQNRSAELLAELDMPIEDLAWDRPKEQFRIASMLGHFGYVERAAALAYRLFLENRDKSQAWMTLSSLVLLQGHGNADEERLWNAPAVAPNVAVDLRYDNGEELFLVIEPNAYLRRVDNESWEPDHPLLRVLMGLAKDARFVAPTGREGTIRQLRHKYVARLHYVMEHYEARFPEIRGFRKIPVDVEKPGGLDEFIAELKARYDWVQEEQGAYSNGPWPLGVLAHRVGLDTIEVAGGLASQGIPLKVAIGNEPEREAAAGMIRENGNKGCVLDLLAFWTAWNLHALDAIAATCGPIRLPQSVIDRLHARRVNFELSASDGIRSASYAGGKVLIQDVPSGVVRQWCNDLDRAMTWIEKNTAISPLLAGDELPAVLREYLRAGQNDIFDSLIVAMQSGILLISDDQPTRAFGQHVKGCAGVSLHQVFLGALHRKKIDSDTFIRWSAELVRAGHSYIGMSGAALARAVQLDAETGEAPGDLFKTLSQVIGGRTAEPKSHVLACIVCLRSLWSDPKSISYRQLATGLLMRQLIHERNSDYVVLVRAVLRHVRDLGDLVEYIRSWVRGHFLPLAMLETD
jgi:hypothetical protein